MARKIVQKTVRDTLAERLITPGNKHGDLLDIIVEELRAEESSLSENLAVDVVSALLFGSVFTLSGVIAVTFKSLHDNPDVVHALEEENRAMLKDRKGYTIPAGWLVIVNPMAAHMNEEFFEDPLKFNPWRWMDESKRSTILKNFLPFGVGIRMGRNERNICISKCGGYVPAGLPHSTSTKGRPNEMMHIPTGNYAYQTYDRIV
uniref:Cytochrome P450 87A3 n=1 Tax=Aegilops tauschii TaxID=37682 RepID=M8BIL1_AEGTA